MKEKEWKKEQKIPLLPVNFPEDSVMQKECRAIVEKAIPKRQSISRKSEETWFCTSFSYVLLRLIASCYENSSAPVSNKPGWIN